MSALSRADAASLAAHCPEVKLHIRPNTSLILAGRRLGITTANMEDESPKFKEGIAYGLWAGWLFGFAGLHRLYMGKYGTGFLWLFTWGLGGCGQIYDLITMRRQIDEANILEEYRARRRGDLPKRGPVRTTQQMLLDAALAEGGMLTVTQATRVTGLDFSQAEGLLREMVAKGYVDVGNEPESGVVVYYFPELRAGKKLKDLPPNLL